MRETQPQVELIARPSLDLAALERFLKHVGGDSWLTMRTDANQEINDGQMLIEAAGRACYRSWEEGLNPNVTRIRRDQGQYFTNLLNSGHGSVLEHANYSFILGDVSRVFCYDEDTEVLTDEGWIPWPKIQGDELFGTLNPRTRELEYQRATERFEGPYDGPMYHVHSQQVDLMVTPNHRMWIQRVDTQAAKRGEQPWGIELAKDILHKRVRYEKGAKWTGMRVEEVHLPATTRSWVRSDTGKLVTRTYPGATFPAKPFARLLGWYLAEGSINQHQICIAQKRGPRLEEMAQVIRGMGLKPYIPVTGNGCVRTSCAPLRDFLADLGTVHTKRVPKMVQTWTPELIREFLAAMIAGDGNTHRTNGHQVIYTVSREMADDLQILAIKAGYSANIRVDDRVGVVRRLTTGQVFKNVNPCYIVSLQRDSRLRPHVNHDLKAAGGASSLPNDDGYQDSMVNYSGRVYCVKVPNGLLFVRRNGKPVVSGNTHELVRHRAGSAFSQESLRFVRLDEIPFRIPEVMEPLRDKIVNIVETLEEFQISAAEHFDLDGEGLPFHVKKEVTSAMRRLAPEGISTVIFWTANVRTLRHTIQMRTHPSAEEELRTVFNRIGEIMVEEAPLLFGDFVVEDGAWTTEYRKV